MTLKAPVAKAIVAALSERDETAEICRDREGNPEPDPDLRDTENVPLSEGVEAYFEREVRPHVSDAWINTAIRDPKDGLTGKVGYVRRLIDEARRQTAVAVNAGLTFLYWRIGDRIRREGPGRRACRVRRGDCLRAGETIGGGVRTRSRCARRTMTRSASWRSSSPS